MTDPVVVYETELALEAERMASLLRDQGLDGVAVGVGHTGSLPLEPFQNLARVQVPAGEEAAARAFLEAVSTSDEAPRPERCPACGEAWEPGFDACWSCGAEL